MNVLIVGRPFYKNPNFIEIIKNEGFKDSTQLEKSILVGKNFTGDYGGCKKVDKFFSRL